MTALRQPFKGEVKVMALVKYLIRGSVKGEMSKPNMEHFVLMAAM